MQEKSDGQHYAPKGKAHRVCEVGQFPVAVVGLDHGHIYGMCNGLKEAGADIVSVFDEDAHKVEAFRKVFPEAKIATSFEHILADPSIKLVASASIPNKRTSIGIRVLESNKDFFSDKPPCTTKQMVDDARDAVKRTGKRFGVYYSERLHVEGATRAMELIKKGAIGDVVHVMGWGPHRIAEDTRPSWFFDKAQYGGILVDIGCHQIEQILAFSGAKDATINSSRIANYHHRHRPDFDDYGDITLTTENNVAAYLRVDWFTPDGLGTWGDGRVMIVGTDGYIELRKYIDIARDAEGDHLYLVNNKGEEHECVAGKAGFPFFGRFIRDCLDDTHHAADQEVVFRAIELAIEAQEKAENIKHN